jgi:hypothetical protein
MYTALNGKMTDEMERLNTIIIILILGWCILLRLFIMKNDSTTLVRN